MSDNIIRRKYTKKDFDYISYLFAPVCTDFKSFKDYKKASESYWKIREEQLKKEG